MLLVLLFWSASKEGERHKLWKECHDLLKQLKSNKPKKYDSIFEDRFEFIRIGDRYSDDDNISEIYMSSKEIKWLNSFKLKLKFLLSNK